MKAQQQRTITLDEIIIALGTARNTTASLSNPLNTRALRLTNFCLSVISKISDRDHQPNYDGKPDDRDSKLKKGFYKFHKEAAGSLRKVSLFVKARGIKRLSKDKFQN